jgi:hypothetical protein
MATEQDRFPSRFFKAEDLGGEEAIVTIRDCASEKLKTQDGRESEKEVVWFEPPFGRKGLVLNKTNFRAIAKATGEPDSSDWVGHKILLYPTHVEMGGEVYEVVRIKSPPKAKPKAKQADGAPVNDGPPDDGVPFNDEVGDFGSPEAAA